MIETNLSESGHEPRNVQVILEALTPDTWIVLKDESGEFQD